MANARFLLDNFSDKATIYSYCLDNVIDISNVENGLTPGTGYVNTTPFSFYNIVRGSEYLPERAQVTTTPDISESLDGTYFTTNSTTKQYYIWYSTNTSTIDPDVTDATSIKINLNPNDTAIQVAYKTKLRLYIEGEFLVQDGYSSDNPIDNIQDTFKESYSQSNDATNIEIVGEFDTARTISCLVLGRHKLPINTRYRLRLYSDATGEERYIKYDTGFLLVNTDYTLLEEDFEVGTNIVEWIPRPIYPVKYFKINFYIGGVSSYYTNSNQLNTVCNLSTIDTNNENLVGGTDYSVAEYFKFGRLFLGNYIEVIYNISYGHNIYWHETTKQYRPGSSTLRSDYIIPNKKLDFSLQTIPEEDRVKLQYGFKTVGLRRDFFVSLFPDNSSTDKQEDYSGIVKLIKVPKFVEFSNNYYTSKYIMEEV